MRISLCMIAKDEERTLPRCLMSIQDLVEEIIVADTGSSDRTAELARDMGAAVFSERWQDDFSRARNAAFSRACGDYLLWLDADDVVTEENRRRFLSLRSVLEEEPCDTVMCPYESGPLRYERERIVRNAPDAKWRGHVHECIPPFGKILHHDFTVTHLPGERESDMRNLAIYRKWEKEEPLSGRDLFYYGRELYYHKFYDEAEEKLRRMLDGEGWYVNKIEACAVLSRCRSERGDPEGAVRALLRSFEYGEPRASALTELGRLHRLSGKPEEAIFWYKCAFLSRDHTKEGDFEQPDHRGIVPALELVCLYHALGKPSETRFWHEKSEALAPDHPSVRFNRNYFSEHGF